MNESSKYDTWDVPRMVAELSSLGWTPIRDEVGRLAFRKPEVRPIPRPLMLAMHRRGGEVLAYIDRLAAMRAGERSLIVETALAKRLEVGDDAP
jgi:hypothetical protein